VYKENRTQNYDPERLKPLHAGACVGYACRPTYMYVRGSVCVYL